jgi:hypothetical protein
MQSLTALTAKSSTDTLPFSRTGRWLAPVSERKASHDDAAATLIGARSMTSNHDVLPGASGAALLIDLLEIVSCRGRKREGKGHIGDDRLN